MIHFKVQSLNVPATYVRFQAIHLQQKEKDKVTKFFKRLQGGGYNYFRYSDGENNSSGDKLIDFLLISSTIFNEKKGTEE